MKKTSKSKQILDEKEEKAMSKYLPYGLMFGVVVGSILSFSLDNLMYLAYGTCGGLIIGLVIGAIVSDKRK